MSKLDDLIRERGCDDLTALQWCREKRAIVYFGENAVSLSTGDDMSCVGKSLVDVVVMHVKAFVRPAT